MDAQALDKIKKTENETIVQETDTGQKTDDVPAPATVAEQEEIIERPYELRDLRDKDLFPMLQILKRIGIKDFKTAFMQVASGEKSVKDKSVKDIGILTAFDMADVLVSNLTKAENEIYTLWSDISGISVDEMREMEFGTLPLMIMDTFSKARNSSFFKVLSKFLS